ncbi:DUF192 domain-containing protein [Gellertiella hungarica]|uniref:DUF192 domain-containing protein n=1 Tax=Gellertiella hungarica TaxID=1572859 RepID=UPI0016228587|nr:DUF192 domain-containing protein [Gellertiella hungarica]
MRSGPVRTLSSALVALFLFVPLLAAQAIGGEIFSREPLTLTRQLGEPVTLNVELALTEAQREQGLMFRRSIGENEGMLFDFGETRMVYMWMKNTVLPLDMLFLDPAGKVVHIHENAVPFSETIIPSVEPVRYVLEVGAGTVKRLNLSKGDMASSHTVGKGP